MCNQSDKKNTTSFQLHGITLVDEEDGGLIEAILKTYNSLSRCAYKKFKSIGLRSMLKFHPNPERRRSGFRDVPLIDGQPRAYECPTGMSDKMWRQVRKEAYDSKRKKANPFWQIDKDLGSPIRGTEAGLGEWARKRGYEFDSTTLHSAVLNGMKMHLSFERQKARYRTSKNNPSFGENELRSKRKLTKFEYGLTKNASMTLIGRKGSSKFHFDLEKDDSMTFTWRRRKIGFSFKSHRFSKKGWEKFRSLVEHMEKGEIPVTFTLTMTAKNKFNLTLTYDQKQFDGLNKVRENVKIEDRVAVIYSLGKDMIYHQVMQGDRILNSELHHLDDLNGRNKNKRQIEELKGKGQYQKLTRLRRTLANRNASTVDAVLHRIFRINKAMGVEKVVVETPGSRRRGAFNRNLLSFNAYDIKNDNGQQGPISLVKLNSLTRGLCSKMGMEFKRADGTFVQAQAIYKSGSMMEAIRTAASTLAAIGSKTKFNIPLTEWSEMVQDPSMLDWVKHLLHNRRIRQARRELKKAVQNGVVEKAIRLIDTRSRCSE